MRAILLLKGDKEACLFERFFFLDDSDDELDSFEESESDDELELLLEDFSLERDIN